MCSLLFGFREDKGENHFKRGISPSKSPSLRYFIPTNAALTLEKRQFAQYIEQMVIPNHEALAKLEAESNEEVDQLLMSLPFWGMVVDGDPVAQL